MISAGLTYLVSVVTVSQTAAAHTSHRFQIRGTFAKTDLSQDQRAGRGKLKRVRTAVMKTLLSAHNKIKLEINEKCI